MAQINRESLGSAHRKNILAALDAKSDLYDKYDVVPVREHFRVSELILNACPHAEVFKTGHYTLKCNYYVNDPGFRGCDLIKCPYKEE